MLLQRPFDPFRFQTIVLAPSETFLYRQETDRPVGSGHVVGGHQVPWRIRGDRTGYSQSTESTESHSNSSQETDLSKSDRSDRVRKFRIRNSTLLGAKGIATNGAIGRY